MFGIAICKALARLFISVCLSFSVSIRQCSVHRASLFSGKAGWFAAQADNYHISRSDNSTIQYSAVQSSMSSNCTEPTWHDQPPALPPGASHVSSHVETLTLVHHIIREDHTERRAEEILWILSRSTREGDARGQRHLYLCPVSPVSASLSVVGCVRQPASQPFLCLCSRLPSLVPVVSPCLPA